MSSSKTALSKNLMCVRIRSGIEFWMERENARIFQEILKRLTQSTFLEIEGESINSADIEGIYSAERMETFTRHKNGMWKCKFGTWHEKRDTCECEETRLSDVFFSTMKIVSRPPGLRVHLSAARGITTGARSVRVRLGYLKRCRNMFLHKKENNVKIKKVKNEEVKKYICTICGGDASVSFQGFYDKNGLNRNGKKNPFKKTDRPCLSCLYKLTGDRIF